MSQRPDSRQFTRAQVTFKVHYRTRGSFLVSYSLNLSKGGLFIETTQLLPIGTRLTVRFTVPGAGLPIETEAVVVWVREEPSPDGMPTGMGIQFENLEETIGESIDRLVKDFTGVRLLAVASDPASADQLSRYLQSILACDVQQNTVSHTLLAGFASRIDLVIIDLDSAGKDGLKVIEMASAAPQSAMPIIAITRSAELRTLASTRGASAVLDNPPPFEELRQVTLDVLGRPCHTSG